MFVKCDGLVICLEMRSESVGNRAVRHIGAKGRGAPRAQRATKGQDGVPCAHAASQHPIEESAVRQNDVTGQADGTNSAIKK